MTDAKEYLAIEAWDNSYERGENHLYWPCDEIIRFVSKYLRRRTGINSFKDVLPGAAGSKILDLGCGVGRNINFGTIMGFEMYGIDLSAKAVLQAQMWMHAALAGKETERIVSGDIRQLPWKDAFFDHALSDSVLDSMSFDVATQGVKELARVLKPGGYFYCNLIAQKNNDGTSYLTGEERKTDQHEAGTIQSYFDAKKIDELFSPGFTFLKRELHMITDDLKGHSWGRWHFVMKRR